MSDIPNSYNTDLSGLVAACERKGVKCYLAHRTLQQIKTYNGDAYGSVQQLVAQALADSGTTYTQTPYQHISIAMDKLTNVWKLWQDLKSGNQFTDYIIISHGTHKNFPVYDVHPGRTRLFFHNSYLESVPVLIIDYTHQLEHNPPFPVTELTALNVEQQHQVEYRITDNWGLPTDPTPKYLLVQPNQNENWHYPALPGDVYFRLQTHNDIVTGITANGVPFITYSNWQWRIEL